MPEPALAHWLLVQEARALRTRLRRIKPLVLQETMVPAAAIAPEASRAIETFLLDGRKELERRIGDFLSWIQGPRGVRTDVDVAQRRFTFLKLRFNAVLTHLDIFSEAMSQRSETDTGVWLAGLDAAARDSLALPPGQSKPPLICYLARDAGGAIRRVRTRLPGGGENPVALVRLPRERMIGCGVASSLCHEVGHQAAEVLDLVPALRSALLLPSGGKPPCAPVWSRWISEIVADLWAIAQVGAASTLGLISLVSLPRAFVFRINVDDPHPGPWIRVRLSCAIGDALYPHPQWARLSRLWTSLYPLDREPPVTRRIVGALDAEIPSFVERLLAIAPPAFRGRRIGDALRRIDRGPARLQGIFDRWRRRRSLSVGAPPTLAFAVLGQARLDGALTPEGESAWLGSLLRTWSLRERGAGADESIAPASQCPLSPSRSPALIAV